MSALQYHEKDELPSTKTKTVGARLVPVERNRLFSSVQLDGNPVSGLQIGAIDRFHRLLAALPLNLSLSVESQQVGGGGLGGLEVACDKTRTNG